ncbi:hypothetical protein CQ12_15285 [Bradyrhizobium jicamae]|uniref:Uncharacterized protein n=1 Tax=Bradyrhizobium jicamae TaxID=280332 RepID=A0A0R3L233_9BRAD|nr:hypothetical protein [Bradyrhizobium jicamae]KRR02028.1 hypothetical protein CQ12_15285 [Bradyrhizobium jicamae]
MRKLSHLVAAASALVLVPAGAALAQGAPSGGTPPAATSSTAAPETTATEKKAAPKKKKPAKMTRQQEIDHSIDRGTVPARYRSSEPKEYHQYIPFDKR